MIPRTKGFDLIMNILKDRVNIIYSITIAFNNPVVSTKLCKSKKYLGLFDLMCGQGINEVNFHVKRINIKDSTD